MGVAGGCGPKGVGCNLWCWALQQIAPHGAALLVARQSTQLAVRPVFSGRPAGKGAGCTPVEGNRAAACAGQGRPLPRHPARGHQHGTLKPSPSAAAIARASPHAKHRQRGSRRPPPTAGGGRRGGSRGGNGGGGGSAAAAQRRQPQPLGPSPPGGHGLWSHPAQEVSIHALQTAPTSTLTPAPTACELRAYLQRRGRHRPGGRSGGGGMLTSAQGSALTGCCSKWR